MPSLIVIVQLLVARFDKLYYTISDPNPTFNPTTTQQAIIVSIKLSIVKCIIYVSR